MPKRCVDLALGHMSTACAVSHLCNSRIINLPTIDRQEVAEAP